MKQQKPQAIAKKPTTALNSTIQGKTYIQVFATSKLDLAKKTAKNLSERYSQTVNYPQKNGIYRIQIGPILDNTTRDELLIELKQNSYPNAYLRSL